MNNSENTDDFVFQTMLTCIGNKRKLVDHIYDIVIDVSKRLSKSKLNIADLFSGSSVVSRKLCSIADNLYINDIELYAYLMAKCYLVPPSNEQKIRINEHISRMNHIATDGPFIEGVISKMYAPKNTNDVKSGERCFYTRENALIIDTLRKYISDCVESDITVYCLVPLLNKASINTNTSGVFKGFHKCNGVGCFGGKDQNATARILKKITLDVPIWCSTSHTAHCTNLDSNKLIHELPHNLDIIYIDPPYNQHPYGSNYFMLNLIASNKEPESVSRVSGIPTDWQRSAYNSHKSAVDSMRELIKIGLDKASFLLISYNNEGIITNDDWTELLRDLNVEKHIIDYNTFRGCRNLNKRSNKVIEMMYLVRKKEQ